MGNLALPKRKTSSINFSEKNMLGIDHNEQKLNQNRVKIIYVGDRVRKSEKAGYMTNMLIYYLKQKIANLHLEME